MGIGRKCTWNDLEGAENGFGGLWLGWLVGWFVEVVGSRCELKRKLLLLPLLVYKLETRKRVIKDVLNYTNPH